MIRFRKWIFLAAVFIYSLSSVAQDSSFCNQTNSDFKNNLLSLDSRISFSNDGGMFNGGVCWWHSRLQRSSVMLAYYSPNKAKPDEKTIDSIIHHLVWLDQVVEIPGYNNFYDFSQANHEKIQKALNQWQLRDGLINQVWIKGLLGRIHVPADTLKSRMHKLFQMVSVENKIQYVKVQLPGITAHALLILFMRQNSNGFELDVIDSNYPSKIDTIQYQYGDTTMHSYYIGGDFMIYPDFDKDLKKIAKARNRFCNPHSYLSSDIESEIIDDQNVLDSNQEWIN